MQPNRQNSEGEWAIEFEIPPRKLVKKDLSCYPNLSQAESTSISKQVKAIQWFLNSEGEESVTKEDNSLETQKKKVSSEAYSLKISELLESGNKILKEDGGEKKNMTKDKFLKSFKVSKEDIKIRYYPKTNLDQLMKTFEQGTNRKINDICQLNLSRKEKEKEITFKPFTEKITNSTQMYRKVKNQMEDIKIFLQKYFMKKSAQIIQEPTESLKHQLIEVYEILRVKRKIQEEEERFNFQVRQEKGQNEQNTEKISVEVQDQYENESKSSQRSVSLFEFLLEEKDETFNIIWNNSIAQKQDL